MADHDLHLTTPTPARARTACWHFYIWTMGLPTVVVGTAITTWTTDFHMWFVVHSVSRLCSQLT